MKMKFLTLQKSTPSLKFLSRYLINQKGYLSLINTLPISALLASGLEIGNVTFIDNIGKDMVIELSFQDEVVLPGLMIPKMSKIDLILGNGIKK